MKSSCKMFGLMLKQISHELMMVILIITPVLAGAIFKFGIPLLETKVLCRFGFCNVLTPYYELFSWLLAMLTSMLFAFVGGLVVLGEIDDGIAKYIMVTPPGQKGYLLSRIVFPGMVSGIVTVLLLPIFSLTKLSIETIFVMAASTVCCGIITALIVVAISSNKVEGMAVGKFSGFFGVVFFVPLLIKGPVRYVFTPFPMYHVGLWSMEGSVRHLIIAAVLFIIWAGVLYKLFRRKFT